tara:strand:+ start:23 stop:337 length:315 start_codon:yes stop_codon:yes gene_type:complete
MAIRGLEGNQNAEPRVFAHDAADLGKTVAEGGIGYTLGDRIPNTDNIGVALYIGATMDLTVKMEGGTEVQFKGVTAGSFLPVLVTHIQPGVTLDAAGGELIALY